MTSSAISAPREAKTNSTNEALAGRRIIFVLGPLEVGGSERQALLLGRHLKEEQGAEVQVWGTMGTSGSLTAICDRFQIPWRIVPFRWEESRAKNLAGMTKFGSILRRERPDIILPYLAPTNLLCNLVWPFTGARMSVWNQRDLGLDRVHSRYEKTAIRRASCFIANSNHVAEYLRQELGVNPARVRVVRNGVALRQPEEDGKTWRERLGLSPECWVACMVANLNDNKDHATLLRAWRIVVDRLHESGRAAALLLAGRFGGTHEALKALAFDLRLGDSVKFLGQVGDISGLLSAVDLGVFSSESEGSPNGVLECMAAGLAVVATDIPGVSEAVDSTSHPFLTPVRDVDAMAGRIVHLATNQNLRRELGEANRLRIENEFHPRRMCEDTVAILRNGLGARAGSQ